MTVSTRRDLLAGAAVGAGALLGATAVGAAEIEPSRAPGVGGSDPVPGDVAREAQNPDLLNPPATDSGTLPNLRFSFAEALAKEKGIEQAGWVRVSCKRGAMVCKAYVTKRIKPMTVDGKPTHVIGVPLHWGFTGQARKGYGANTLTPSVGDANTQTPEFKAFLVNVEKVAAPVA